MVSKNDATGKADFTDLIPPEPPDMSSHVGLGREGSESDHAANVIPPRINGYRFTRFIAHGGMGAVWQATNLKTSQEVAVKVIGPLWRKPHAVRSVFEKELKLAARLVHPNIARVYGGDTNHTPPYYVMHLVDGIPLDKYMQERKLSVRQILELIRSVCDGVQHAHNRLIIHRDLKFSNILVTNEGKPYIIDFGLAKSLNDGDPYTTIVQPGYAMGTLLFMSPEQAAGNACDIDVRTDVYSLGVILYRLLTGQFPFSTAGAPAEVVRRIIEDDPKPPTNIDKELKTLLLTAIAKEPERRYESARVLGLDISNYLAKRRLIANPDTILYRVQRYISRNRTQLTLLTTLSTVILMIVCVWFYREYYLRTLQRSLMNETEILSARIQEVQAETDHLIKQYEKLQEEVELYKTQGQDTRRSASNRINTLNSTIANLIDLNEDLKQKLNLLQQDIEPVQSEAQSGSTEPTLPNPNT